MTLLTVKNLIKSYVIDKNKKQEVLKGVDLTFNAGQMVAILGESGSGKSTLLNIIGGLDSDYQGEVEVGGQKLSEYSDKQLDLSLIHISEPTRRTPISYAVFCLKK